MNAYLMSSISFLAGQKLDFAYIWKYQRVQQEVIDKVEELIPLVWGHITGNDIAGKQFTDVGPWTKKPECWHRLKLKLGDFDKFDAELLQKEINDDGSYLNEEQQNCIQEAESVEANYWFSLANWAKKNDYLTPLDRKNAFNYGTIRSRNRSFKTLKQAQIALKLIEKAKELGYKG